VSFALRSAPVVAVVALLAAGCGGGSHATTTNTQVSRAARWHQVVLCARAHGMPNLADPSGFDSSGKPIYPHGLDIPQQTRDACQSLFDRLFPGADQHPAPNAAQMAGLIRFARCMRAHGVHDWPDPSPDGTFRPDARLSHLLKSAIRDQLTACERYNPDPRGRVYFGTP